MTAADGISITVWYVASQISEVMRVSRELEQTVQELCFESSLQVRTNHRSYLQELTGRYHLESHTNQLVEREKDARQKRHTGREKHRLCTTVTCAVRQTQ